MKEILHQPSSAHLLPSPLPCTVTYIIDFLNTDIIDSIYEVFYLFVCQHLLSSLHGSPVHSHLSDMFACFLPL